MENKKKDIFEKIKKIKGIEYIIIGIIALLIVVVLITDNFSLKETTEEGGTTEYVSLLEERLEKTLSQIKGAGRVDVVITVAGGNTTVIAQDKTTSKDGSVVTVTETPVLVGGKIVVLSEQYPDVTGVLIVSQGADSLAVRLDLLSAATTLLSVDDGKVEILTGK